MSAPHGVVIRAHPRHEGALVEAIRASDEDLEVVRRCADMAEVSAAARSGVADLALLDEEVVVPPALLGEAPLEVREEEFDVHAPTVPHDGA